MIISFLLYFLKYDMRNKYVVLLIINLLFSDQVVAASGLPRKELGDKPISRALETAIASRQTVALNQQSGGRMVAVTTEEDQNPNYTAQVISPIIADGEAIGAVLLMSRDNGVKMGDTELKVAETAAGIVGRQMEQ